MPREQHTLVESMVQQLRFLGITKMSIVPPAAAAQPEYPSRPRMPGVVGWAEVAQQLWAHEPSDWLLFVEAATQATETSIWGRL